MNTARFRPYFLIGCFNLFLSVLTVGGQTFDANPVPYDTVGFKERKASAETIISELKSGVLVVRFASNARKIEELGRLANSPEVESSRREKFKKWAERTIVETQEENLLIANAFTTNYTFSKVLFMYDTSVHLLKSGVQTGYFLNPDLEIDPLASLEGAPWYIVYHNQSPRGFVMLDRGFDEIKRPFPIPQKVETKRFLFFFKRNSLLSPVEQLIMPPGIFTFNKEERKLSRELERSLYKRSQRYFFEVILWNSNLKKYLEKSGQ